MTRTRKVDDVVGNPAWSYNFKSSQQGLHKTQFCRFYVALNTDHNLVRIRWIHGCDDYCSSWCVRTMMTSSNGNISPSLPLCEGNHRSQVDSPHKGKWRKALMFSFFDLRLNKRLSKQSRRRWFETPSHPLWCHCNDQNPKISWHCRVPDP